MKSFTTILERIIKNVFENFINKVINASDKLNKLILFYKKNNDL
jgi:hypothetical protein